MSHSACRIRKMYPVGFGDAGQVYLPIGWSTYFFSAARVPPFNLTEVARAKATVEALLQSLDKRRSYFSVVQVCLSVCLPSTAPNYPPTVTQAL
jgi:hypothetical protein